MTRTIMVGVDGAAEHRAALEWAATHAARDGAALDLVFVVERSWSDSPDEPDERLVSAAKALLAAERQVAVAMVERSAVLRPAAGGGTAAPHPASSVSTRYFYGHVGAELASASRDAELLVVGSRTRGDRDRGFAGSLAVRVAATAACSVAVIPHGWDGPGTGVVVGVDDGDSADTAVRFAADEASALGEPLHIVCVGYSANPLLAGLVPEESLGDRRQRIVERAAASARELHPGLDIRADVIEAAPSRGLVSAAHGTRLLVVGTHNRRGAKRLMLGSVSHDVLLNVRVPVVVAREHRDLGLFGGAR